MVSKKPWEVHDDPIPQGREQFYSERSNMDAGN